MKTREAFNNTLRFIRQLEKLERQAQRYADAGGSEAIVKPLRESTFEAFCNVLSNLTDDNPTDEQLRLSRILIGKIVPETPTPKKEKTNEQ